MILVAMPYCKKKTTDSFAGTEGAALVIATTPANGTTEPPAPGPGFPLRVTISSAMPASGVTIEVKGKTRSFRRKRFLRKHGTRQQKTMILR